MCWVFLFVLVLEGFVFKINDLQEDEQSKFTDDARLPGLVKAAVAAKSHTIKTALLKVTVDKATHTKLPHTPTSNKHSPIGKHWGVCQGSLLASY